MKKYFCVICTVMILFCLTSVVNASNTEITIGNILASQGETVDVPITISGNTGIAGAVIKITYDENLVFNGATSGSAFSSLTFTPPNDLSIKPVTLLWDGIDSDNTNGTIAILSFIVPNKSGTFNISANYDNGGIYDGDLNDINVKITNGKITVSGGAYIIASGKSPINIQLQSENSINGIVLVGLYDNKNNLIELKTYNAGSTITAYTENANKAAYAKVMWWNSMSLMNSMCDAKTILY